MLLVATLLVVANGASSRGGAERDGATVADRAQARALEAAHRTGKTVRIPELTTETAEYVAQPNGDVRVTISAGPVRTGRSGHWVPIDLDLRRKPNGDVEPIAHLNDLRISGGRGDGTHEVAVVGRGASRVALTWTGRLPEPVLAEERATYVDALPGVDLVVAATREGFAQTLVVKDRAAVERVASVRMTLVGDAVADVKRESHGGLSLTDRAGAILATVPALRMWDARTSPDGSHLRATGIATSVERIARGAALTLTPDLDWIRDAATAFPVTLDPTVTPVSDTFDAYVWENHGDDYSGKNDLRVGKLRLGTGVWEGNMTRSYLTWNTPMLAGKQVTSATVELFNFWSDAEKCAPRGWRIWTAGEASPATRWNNQPPLLTLEAESTGTAGHTDCADAWVSIDGTSFFQRAANSGGSQAFMGLTATDEVDPTYFKQFRSNNANSSAEVPRATVTYNGWPTITSLATNPTTTCATGATRPAVNTLTPQLRATAADSDASSLSVTFEWWQVGASTPLGSTTVSGVAPGGTASVTIPAGTWADGGSYRWRATASDGVAGSSTWSSFCELTVYVTAPPVSGCQSGTPNDYNGDGVSDLVIADPEATVDGKEKAGALRVVYGGTGTVQTVTETSARVMSVSEAGDQFGFAMATYDANRDGCGDLAVSAPFEDLDGMSDVGWVYTLLGAPAGLGAGPAGLTWYQSRGATDDTMEPEDWFGYSLAAGQTDTGEPYLLIGAPGEDLGSAVDTGLVHYIRGTTNVAIDQNIAGSGDANETDDRFGTSVAGSPSHLAAGRPGEEVNGQAFAGALTVYRHALTSGLPTRLGDIRQGDQGVDVPEAGDQMGASLALAPLRSSQTATGESALLVGAPGEDLTVGTATIADAGVVQRYRVEATGYTAASNVTLATGDVDGDPADGDYFGQRVAVVNLAPGEVSTGANVRIVVGTPGKDGAAGPDTGQVNVLEWSATPGATDVVVERGASGLPGTQASMNLLGLSFTSVGQNLYLASPYGEPTVYALSWPDLVAGRISAARTFTPGAGGIPADAVAFGATLS